MQRDIRAIVMCQTDYNEHLGFFEKNNTIRDEADATGNPRRRDFCSHVALADFDAILTYGLNDPHNQPEDVSVLQTILNENCALAANLNDVRYYYPLYLIRYNYGQAIEEKNRVDGFWRMDRSFFFCTSIYQDEAIEAGETTGDYALEQIEEAIASTRRGDLDFDFLVYRTLQISQFMVTWKSNSMQSILTALQRLYEEKPLYSRTVCSIPYTHCTPYIAHHPGEYESIAQELGAESMRPCVLNDEVLLPVEIRAVAKSYVTLMKLKSHPYFEALAAILDKNEGRGLNAFFTFGNEDVTFSISGGLQSQGVFDWICTLLGVMAETDGIRHFRKATDDVRTNISIPIDSNYSYTEDASSLVSAIEGCDKFLQSYIQVLRMNTLIQKEPWFFDFVNLVQQFHSMSSSCVSRGICSLMLDTAYFLCSWIKHVCELEEAAAVKLLTQSRKQINDTLDGWARLASHTIRSDAIVSHRPMTPPPGDNVCTGTVEYFSIFFRKAAELFDNMDNSHVPPCPAFAVLTLPILCRRIKTFERFGENANTVDVKAPKSSLFCIEVPVESIADPQFVIATIIHETAHYFGERRRDERLSCLLQCVIYHIGDALKLKRARSYAYMLNTLQDLFFQDNDSYDTLLFWSAAQNSLIRAIFMMLDTPDFSKNIAILESGLPLNKFSGVYKVFVRRKRRKIEELTMKSVVLDRKLHEMDYSGNHAPVDNLIELLKYLLKECFADVLCIFTLGLSPVQYYKLFNKEIHGMKDFDDSQQRLRDRLQMVTRVLIRAGYWSKPDYTAIDELKNLIDMKSFLSDVNADSEGAMQLIEEYLGKCFSLANDACEDKQGKNAAIQNELQYQYAKVITWDDAILSGDFNSFILRSRQEQMELYRSNKAVFRFNYKM